MSGHMSGHMMRLILMHTGTACTLYTWYMKLIDCRSRYFFSSSGESMEMVCRYSRSASNSAWGDDDRKK